MNAFASDLRVTPERAALLVVDVQERLFAAMSEDARTPLVRRILTLVELARRLGFAVVWSEQYRKGLGPTIGPLDEALAPLPGVRRLEKLEFGCTDAPAWPDIWDDVRRDQWIVTGVETHVCVYQTVRGLVGMGAMVHVPADAVISRTVENRDIGLGLCARAGAIITSTEVVVFDALRRAGSDDFRAMSRLVK